MSVPTLNTDACIGNTEGAYTKFIGLETISLLKRLPLFGEAFGEAGVAGVLCPLDVRSSYLGPATVRSSSKFFAEPHKNRDADWGEGIKANKS